MANALEPNASSSIPNYSFLWLLGWQSLGSSSPWSPGRFASEINVFKVAQEREASESTIICLDWEVCFGPFVVRQKDAINSLHDSQYDPEESIRSNVA